MEIPTRLVVMKVNGLAATINASDFDPALHDLPEEDKTAGIATVNIETALSIVASTTEAKGLDALETEEKANEKTAGGRKGVLAAIEKRREALKAGK